MSGLEYEDWLALHQHKVAGRKRKLEPSHRLLRDSTVVGYDIAEKDGDFSAITVARVPGRIRQFLRRIGLDRSTWKYKIVYTDIIKKGEKHEN